MVTDGCKSASCGSQAQQRGARTKTETKKQLFPYIIVTKEEEPPTHVYKRFAAFFFGGLVQKICSISAP